MQKRTSAVVFFVRKELSHCWLLVSLILFSAMRPSLSFDKLESQWCVVGVANVLLTC